MISLTSKTNYASAVYPDANPPVTFLLRRYSEGLRHRLAMAVSSLARELSESSRDLEPLLDEYRAANKGKPIDEWPDPSIDIIGLMQRKQNIVDSIHHVWIREVFISASGIELDGKPLTADGLIADGDPKLYTEIRDAVTAACGLSPKEKENLEPPSTSGAVEGGISLPTTAPTAGSRGSTEPETAPAISPAT